MACSYNNARHDLASAWNNRTSSVTMWARRRGDPGVATQFWFNQHTAAQHQWALATAANGDDVLATALEDGGNHNTANVLTGMVTDTWYYFFWSRDDTSDALSLKYLASGGSSFAGNVSTTGEFTPDAAGSIFQIGDNDTGGVAIEIAAVKIWQGVALSDADALTERTTLDVTTNTGNEWANYQLQSGALTTDSSGNGRTLSVGAGTPSFVADPSDIGGAGATRKAGRIVLLGVGHGAPR